MIRIDRLRFYLPSALQPHARDFANQFALELANLRLSQGAHIESLKLGPVIVDPQHGVRTAASAAAAQIRQEIDGGKHAK